MSRRRLLLLDMLAMFLALTLILSRADNGWIQVLSWLVLICGASLFVGLILGGMLEIRERQVPRISDDGQSIDSLANAVRETRLGREHAAQFAVWEQELHERERHDG